MIHALDIHISYEELLAMTPEEQDKYYNTVLVSMTPEQQILMENIGKVLFDDGLLQCVDPSLHNTLREKVLTKLRDAGVTFNEAKI